MNDAEKNVANLTNIWQQQGNSPAPASTPEVARKSTNTNTGAGFRGMSQD